MTSGNHGSRPAVHSDQNWPATTLALSMLSKAFVGRTELRAGFGRLPE